MADNDGAAGIAAQHQRVLAHWVKFVAGLEDARRLANVARFKGFVELARHSSSIGFFHCTRCQLPRGDAIQDPHRVTEVEVFAVVL